MGSKTLGSKARGDGRRAQRGPRWAQLALAGGLALALGGCLTATDLPPKSVVEKREPLEDLEPVGSCESLQGVLAVRALAQMEPILKRNEALATTDCDALPIQPIVQPALDGSPETPRASSGPGIPGYSRSNDQVEGVVEPDQVQTDGEHLYVLTSVGLEILRVWPPEAAGHVATLRVEDGQAQAMFVAEGHAVLYIDLDQSAAERALPDPEDDLEVALYGPYGAPHSTGGLCPFGVRCAFSGNGRDLRVLTVDLADPAAPRVVRQTDFSGSYLAARRIGDAVYTAIDFPPPAVPGLSFWPKELHHCGIDRDQARAAFDALRRANVAALVDRPLSTWLPRVVDVRLPGTDDALEVEGLIEGCDSVWYAHLQSGRSFLSLVSQTMAGNQRLATQTIVAEPGAVYVSPERFYVASRQRAVAGEQWFGAVPDHTEATVLHRFGLETQTSPVDGRVRPVTRYQGSAVVPGLLLNRFALDERGGQLRVLSTLGQGGAPEGTGKNSNRDPILDYAPAYGAEVSDAVLPGEPAPEPNVPRSTERRARLALLGSNSIGRLRLSSEAEAAIAQSDLSAVRFVGDWAFLAFGADEPLQIVDLSDPDRPEMRGNLKLAGEARFLHPLGGDRLVSVSVIEPPVEVDSGGGGTGVATRPSDEDSATVQNEEYTVELALELFDLANPDAARSLGRARFAGARSAAETDSLAVSWFGSRSVLGVPVQQCAAETDEGAAPDFDGLVVFGVDPTEGFVERGRVDHLAGPPAVDCTSVPAVRRSVFIDDTVVSIGPASVTLTGLTDFATQAVVRLTGNTLAHEPAPTETEDTGSETPQPIQPDQPEPER